MPGTLLVNKIGAATGTEISFETGHSMAFTTTQFKLTGGTAGQAITTDGSGNLTFADVTSDPTMGGDLSGLASNAQIVADAVGTTEIATDAITTNEIAAGAVGATEIASTIDLSSKTVIVPASTVTAHVAPVDLSKIETNLAIVAFHSAANVAKYNMEGQFIDNYGSTSGIDTTNSIAAERNTAGYVSGVQDIPGNYFGDGSDGALSTSGNVTHTVANKNGSYDGDIVIMQYTDLTINVGHTMTTDQPCRGMFIYVSGDCIINGTISMNGRGAYADPTATGSSDGLAVPGSGLQLGLRTVGGNVTFTNDGTAFSGCGVDVRTAITNQAHLTGDGEVLTVAQVGGVGGAGHTTDHPGGSPFGDGAGNAGGTITNGSGGGGSGGEWTDGNMGSTERCKGGLSSCFSGGSGGGSLNSGGGSGGNANLVSNNYFNAVDYGGAGGNGRSGHTAICSQGPGNPSGNDSTQSGHGGASYVGGANDAEHTGTGGLIFLIVGGNLTLGLNGKIIANGSSSRSIDGNNVYDWLCTGGGSGGGNVRIAHGGTITNGGAITATGGLAGILSNYDSVTGGAGNNYAEVGGPGGDGTVVILDSKGSTQQSAADMTLISETVTAESTPTTADLIIHLEDIYGNTVQGTDMKAYISRNGNADWSSELTLTTEVDLGSNQKILVAKDIDVSSFAGTTSMRYKIETFNQGVGTRDTRIHATSLAWS